MTLSRADLTPNQRRAVDWIKTHDSCALWFDMGGGKTVSTLTAYLDLLASFDARRMLVIAPKRVASRVWSDEIEAWSHLHGLSISRAVGDAQQVWSALKRPADIHTIGRDRVQWLEAQIIHDKKQVRRWPWDLVVLDESQSFRSGSAKRFKSLRRLRKLIPRLVELTGTPSPNGYQNLWAQLYLLDQGQRLGGTEDAFLDRWFDNDRIEDSEYRRRVLKEGAKAEIELLVSDLVLSLPTETEDFEVRYNPIRVSLAPAELKLYRKLQREAIAEIGGRTITAVNAGVVVGKLLQLANGACYYDREGRWVHVHNEKLDALLEVVDGIDRPLIVCYGFKHDLERLRTALGKTSKRVDVLKSDAALDRWNRGETDVLLLHPASAGHGLNLQHAGGRDIVWFGLTSDLELYSQANARLIGGHRRREGVTIHTILADDTYDWDVKWLLDGKGDSQTGLMRSLARLSASAGRASSS